MYKYMYIYVDRVCAIIKIDRPKDSRPLHVYNHGREGVQDHPGRNQSILHIVPKFNLSFLRYVKPQPSGVQIACLLSWSLHDTP